jgi:hypothetical protein
VIEYFRGDPEFKVVESDTRPKGPKQFTGEDYQTVMDEINRPLNEADGTIPSGGGSGSSDVPVTGGTEAKSRKGSRV